MEYSKNAIIDLLMEEGVFLLCGFLGHSYQENHRFDHDTGEGIVR